jgi:hypothetical protein
VGELLGDELQKPWWSSLIRNLADKVAPERLPALALTSTPVQPDSASSWLYAPRWSELLTGPKIFYPDKPKEARASIPSPRIVVAAPVKPRNIDPETMREVREVMKERRRSLRWAHMREGLWIACAVAEVVLIVFYSVK